MFSGGPQCRNELSKTKRRPSLNLRFAAAVKILIRRAAKLRGCSLTDFVLRASRDAAEAVLAEQPRFVLPKVQWLAFNAALDAPAELKRLFTRF